MHGDCHVDTNYNSGKARLDIYHTRKNYDLILKKKAILEQVNGVKVTIVEKEDSRPLKNGGTRRGYRLKTNFSRYFFTMKVAPFKFVSKQLVKPKALALLWMDDGTVCWHRKGDKAYFSTATLATDDWQSYRLACLRRAWNNAYGWCPSAMPYRCRGVLYTRLRLTKNQTEKLTEVIRNHVVESMQYKLVPFKTSEGSHEPS